MERVGSEAKKIGVRCSSRKSNGQSSIDIPSRTMYFNMSDRYSNRLIVVEALLIACIFLKVVESARHRLTDDSFEYDAPRHKGQAKQLPRRLLLDALQNGQYFQDIFAEHLAPLKIEFGHVCENPKEWEQRFERKDMENNQHQGKVRWGNKNGEYGEHYWDLNHRR